MRNIRIYLVLVAVVIAPQALCLEQNELTAPIVLSNQTPDFNRAYKTKLVRLKNGVLVAVYGDSVEDNPARYVYDLKADAERPARDVFVRSCDAINTDCSQQANWSSPINISNTAASSSINSDWNADGSRTPSSGDSDNPHVFATGSHVVVTWGDKYCPGGAQRTVTYLERDSREIPMSCVHVAHASGNIASAANWTVDRLSDGSRDIKHDVSRGLSSGAWAVIWQEDPLGLQPGEAEGPGDGASGAKVSHGTDIWYSYTSNVSTATGDIGVWSTPVRITDNQTGFGIQGSFNPIKDVAGNAVSPGLIDKGNTGASRANLALVGGSSPPKVVVAYEETKGSAGLDEGKFLRYQTFNYNAPPTDIVCNSMAYENCKVGCILSKPVENARRARFVPQTNAGSNSGIRWAVFWRQGSYTQGGPADVMLRVGYTDFSATNLQPTVDFPACLAPDYASAINLVNTAPLNISSNTTTATATNLADATDANMVENSRAHRAVLRGDFLNVAYIYTPDWAVAEYTDLENYNYYVRHFDAATGVWDSPANLSQVTDTSINVKEPRLIGPPGSGSDCSDPQAPVDERDCQNKNVLVAAWGTETNVYSHLGGAEHLDVFLTRSTDQASSFEPVVMLASGTNAQGESQLRITPDGTEIYAAWNEADSTGSVNSMYSQITGQPIPPTPPQTTPQDTSSSGCTLNPRGNFDPLLPFMLLASIFYLLYQRKNVRMDQEIGRNKR